MVAILLMVMAFTILGWYLLQTWGAGSIARLSGLQTAVLAVPWLVFLGLAAAQIYLNLVLVLFMVIIATVAYIVLGKRLRAAQEKIGASLKKAKGDPSLGKSTLGPDLQPGASQLMAPMSNDALKAVQGIFGFDSFFATETIPYEDGAIFRGNLRGSPEAVYSKLSHQLAQRLGNRYRLFMMQNQDQKPVVVVLPRDYGPRPVTRSQVGLAVISLLATLLTCLEGSYLQLGFSLSWDWAQYRAALPLAMGISGVLIAHEIGHLLLARRYQVRLSPPFLLPAWQLGSFGAITTFTSFLPNRLAFFDIAFAGPALGGLVGLVLLGTGLALDPGPIAWPLPSSMLTSSILVGSLVRLVLGETAQTATILVHPLVLAGWIGLIITALNFLPAGRLDGGRVIQAIYGRKVAERLTIFILVLLAIGLFINSIALYWGLIILFAQRHLERPTLNGLIEPDNTRVCLALGMFLLAAIILLPLPPTVASWLNLGGIG